MICTHGHSDHVGNLSLFPHSLIIVGCDISRDDTYMNNELKSGVPYILNSDIEVIHTPGHTGNDISVIVRNTPLGTIVVTGDLFEREDDIEENAIWRDVSENPDIQAHHRHRVLQFADFIIPGHGKMFRVIEKYRNLAIGQTDHDLTKDQTDQVTV